MSKPFAGILGLVMLLAVGGPTIAQDRVPGRANPTPGGEKPAEETVAPRDVLVWEFRIGEASWALDVFLDGPRCIPPRPEREWIVTYDVDTYVARPGDSTPQGYTHYGVSGLGGTSDVRVLRSGDRVLRLFCSEPLGRP